MAREQIAKMPGVPVDANDATDTVATRKDTQLAAIRPFAHREVSNAADLFMST